MRAGIVIALVLGTSCGDRRVSEQPLATVTFNPLGTQQSGICCGASCCRISGSGCTGGSGVTHCCATGEAHASQTCLVCQPGNSQVDWSVAAGSCFIASQCYADAAAHPSLTCLSCAASSDQLDWTVNGGSCYIDGQCYAHGDPNPANVCEGCDSTADQSDWSAVAGACADDGHPCTDDVCNAGACSHPVVSGCLIDGSCVVEDALDPANACTSCQSATSTTNYSPLPQGTSCAPQSCSGGMLTLEDTCDDAGNCQDMGTTTCGAYANCADAVNCDTDCGDISECVAGADCIGDECVASFADGEDCTNDNQCESTFCRDGVCCATDCQSLCVACRETLTGVGDGTCASVLTGLDPRDDCTAAASSCGHDGSCDGSGACRYALSTVSCATPFCNGSGERVTQHCDGLGSCAAAQSASCAPYVCSGEVCTTSCSGDGECDAGAWCNSGECTNANRAPTAMIAGDQVAHGGDVVTLSGLGSVDPDGDALTFSWSQASGPTAALSSTSGADIQVDLPEVSTDVQVAIALVVNDGSTSSSAAMHEIMVEPAHRSEPKSNKDDSGCAATGSGGSGWALVLLLCARVRRRVRGRVQSC